MLAAIGIIIIYFTTDIYHFGFKPLSYLTLSVILIHVASSGGAVDEGLVRELERQEAATRAVQCGHQQRSCWLPHQLPSTTPGYFG